MNPQIFRAIGMISGTSIDGIDTALIETDGYSHVRSLAFMPHSYDSAFRQKLRTCLGNQQGTKDPEIAAFERELTELHAILIAEFLQQQQLQSQVIDVIGFHGQTIWHRPEERVTIQLGDGALLAQMTGIPVINDFRSADVKAGGHGAPLVPLYHRALATKLPKPAAIINIGGVSNVTWIGGEQDVDLLAFDLGPGNALIDDWMLRHAGKPYDDGGTLAAQGKVDERLVQQFMAHPFFKLKPPKSLDRDAFNQLIPEALNAADGVATLTMMTAKAIAHGMQQVPQQPAVLYITGGGRHNHSIMRWLAELTELPVKSVDALGWSGDGLEAEAFGYLAVRSKLGLPLSVPGTTGVPRAMTGGHFHKVELAS